MKEGKPELWWKRETEAVREKLSRGQEENRTETEVFFFKGIREN